MKQPVLNGVLESPLDLNGYGFVNIGGLLGTFQLHSAVLDTVAATSPSYAGLSLLQLANPLVDSFLKIQANGVPAYVTGGGGGPLTIVFSPPLFDVADTVSIPAATGSVDGYLAHADWTTFNAKQAALGFTPENITNKVTGFSSPTDAQYPSAKLVSDQLALKLHAVTDEVNVEDYASFAAALAAIGSSTKTLLIPSSQTVTANASVPATCTLRFTGSGKLVVNSGVTLTIARRPVAALGRQIFQAVDSTSLIRINEPIEPIPLRWYGLVADGSTDDTPIIQNAVDGANNNTLFVLPENVTIIQRSSIKIYGTSKNGIGIVGPPHQRQNLDVTTNLKWDGASGGTMIDLINSGGGYFSGFSMYTSNGGNAAASCINIDKDYDQGDNLCDIASGTKLLTGGHRFRARMVGRTITVAGAGLGGTTLTTTVASFIDFTSLLLTDNASTTVTAAATTVFKPSSIPSGTSTEVKIEEMEFHNDVANPNLIMVSVAYNSWQSCEMMSIRRNRFYQNYNNIVASDRGRGVGVSLGSIVGGGGENNFNQVVSDNQINGFTYAVLANFATGTICRNEFNGSTVDINVVNSRFLIENNRSENGRQFLFAANSGRYEVVSNDIALGNWDASYPTIEWTSGGGILKLENNSWDNDTGNTIDAVKMTGINSEEIVFSKGNQYPNTQHLENHKTFQTFRYWTSEMDHPFPNAGYPRVAFGQQSGDPYSGVIATIGRMSFAALPTNGIENGSVAYVTNGTPGTNPLAGSGSGCFADRVNGAWVARHADDTAYDATSWNANLGMATKNAIRDKFESLSGVYQPLASNLTSWAASTRATGFDTFTATPSIANLKSLLTNETDIGWAFFSATNPSAIAFPRANADNSLSLLSASDFRTALSLVPGTDVQAYDADLTTWAGITPGTGVGTALAVNVGSAGAFVTNGGALGTPSSGTLTNCTFPTLNQNTTGSAASLSVSGQTGLLTFTGSTSTNRIKTVRDAADTILELGGSYTPTGTWTNMTLVTPALGTPSSLVLTNATGSPTGISLTKAQLNTIVSDDDPAYLGTAQTFTAAQTSSFAGAASTPAMLYSGAWYAAGTGTTNFPHFLLQATGTTASATWSTAGTAIGVNAVTGFTGNLLDLKLAGTTKFKVDSTGLLTGLAGATFSGTIQSSNWNLNTQAYFQTNGDGVVNIQLSPSANSGFTGLSFGGTTNSFPRLSIDAVNGFTLQSSAATSTWNDKSTAASGTVANRYLFGIAAPTLTATNGSVTDTIASTFYIGGAPVASTNTTIGTAYALYVATGNTFLGGKVAAYNNIATEGNGVAAIVKATRITAQISNATVATYTTPASDGSYLISGNINVTTAIAISTSLNVDYTDETNTARTMIIPISGLGGTFLAGGLATSTGPFESSVMHIRTKASTTITIYTAAGTFTSATYNAEGAIRQIQ